ncbi:hypothetical protein MD484_g8727, partial [Candolleomyces efflorescens]
MVISSEGYFYLYSIDLEKGGECSLLKQYSLLDSVDVEPTSTAIGTIGGGGGGGAGDSAGGKK